MRSRLDREFLVVRAVAALGACVTLIGLLLTAVLFAVCCYAFSLGLLDALLPLQLLFVWGDVVSGFVVFLSLFLFFTHLTFNIHPFGRRQVNKVALAGHVFMLRLILTAAETPFPKIVIEDGPVPLGITFDGGLDLKFVAFLMIILCAATIMRYGNVLEAELSDIA